MKLCIVFTRMLVHVIHNFNRGLTGAPMDEPERVMVQKGVFVKQEGEPSGYSACD